MRCAACSAQIDGGAPHCDQCGAAVATASVRDGDLPPDPPRPAQSRFRGWMIGSILALALAMAAAGVWWWPSHPVVTSNALQAAVHEAMRSTDRPGRDPVCVANGLAYDQAPVNVLTDNAATLSWMNALVSAGLYEAPEGVPDGVPDGAQAQPILVFKPLPALAQWGGARRLCIARGVKLADVANLGPVENQRVRGKRYVGVTADVRWTLDEPAPWLAQPEVGEALRRELPSWRGARWQPDAEGWQLLQRRNFVHVDAQWVPSAFAEGRATGVKSEAVQADLLSNQ